ncbi:Protein CBG25067 [Caenorhabditis briggsae]|uniref:Protein CBG25067 n=1 Tax=Caenorhabditis briggsae TaxID=6238 RepID=A8WM17_CAEBR|nr:Protein CBG25067 [Caenorhabditis briggsae]
MYGLGFVVNSAKLANARSLWFNVGALNHLHRTWSLGQGVVFSRAVLLSCDLLRLSFD